MVIDGDCGKESCRSFSDLLLPPFQDTYFVEGMMMYDADNLYISAHVGDPDPMRNTAPADADFAGGSVSVRLSTDREMGWPLKGTAWRAFDSQVAIRPSLPVLLVTMSKEPKELDSSLRPCRFQTPSATRSPILSSHTTPRKGRRIRMAYGFDSHDSVIDPPGGWRGAYRKDADGRG